MGTEKKTPEIKQTTLIRRQPKDTHWDAEYLFASPVPYSPLPFLHLSPKQTCKSPDGLQLSAREEKYMEVGWGRERKRDKERESKRENRWQAPTKGRTLCLARCRVTGPWGQQGTTSLPKKNRKIKDGATLTSIVVNDICQQMSYGTKQKQLV